MRRQRADYPTWRRCSRNLWVSLEALDGVSDWMLMCDGATKRWHISGRTSGHWHSQTFPTAAAAKTFVEEQCKR